MKKNNFFCCFLSSNLKGDCLWRNSSKVPRATPLSSDYYSLTKAPLDSYKYRS